MSGSYYRVDKFTVPEEARDEFLMEVLKTHQVMKTQQGFISDAVLEHVSGSGEFNFVTIAQWESLEVMELAKAAISAAHKADNFNPQAVLARLGIRADMANYKPVAA
jgi:heme-degrading monooxygenase HmoA